MTTNHELISISAGALTPAELIAQHDLLLSHLKSGMKAGTHYGLIPGCGDKPCLHKSGAEYLLFVFNLACSFEHVSTFDFAGRPGHLQIMSTCTLTHRPSGVIVAQGTGICSTLESKYRYRTSFTGRAVPREYWTTKDKSILGGAQFDTRKVNGEWQVLEQVEYDNPADYYNTVIKMADKRAIVAAVLYGTGASELFTQDLEDAPELFKKNEQMADAAPRQQNQQRPAAANGDVKLATPAQLKLINFELEKHKISLSWVDECLEAVTGQKVYTLRNASALIETLKTHPLDERLKQFVGAPAKQEEESAHI